MGAADSNHHAAANRTVLKTAQWSVAGPFSPTVAAAIDATVMPSHELRGRPVVVLDVQEPSLARIVAVQATSAAARPSTMANHSGRVSHHEPVSRSGVGSPSAMRPAHSASAVRCQR